jgi:hypothetical protein
MITLVLNDQPILGYELKITAELALPEEDLSGQGSSSLSAEQGIKPKRLRVSLKIKHETPGYLSDLISLASAVDAETGKRVVYTIENDTANAFSVRQVRFTEKISANELGETQAWQVAFVLLEQQSIPEKIEAKRIEKTEPKVAAVDNKVISETAVEEPTPGWFERLFASLDNALSDEGKVTDEV